MESKCNNEPKIKHVILVKKGMAAKAFLNNIKTGNTKKLSAQVAKGTVKRIT